MTITEKLSSYFANLKYDDLPEDVIREVKRSILDSLGCIIAGSQVSEVENLKNFFDNENEQNDVNLIGFNNKSSVYEGLLLNGTMGHAVEMDDVHKRAKAHAGAVVVPTALTVSDKLNSSGKELLMSVLNGYEIMLRIGRGINATEHRLKGWHATGTCGSFGAAAAVASLYHFNEAYYMNALGLAGTQSSGLWAFTSNGANSKMFHTGSASLSGYIATQLALGGLTGSNQIIEAEDGGLFKASSSNYSFDYVIEDIGKEFLINDITRKPFACCRSMHPSIEAALEIRKELNDLDDIKKINVYTYEVAKVQCGYTKRPQNVSDAKFSIPYGVAVALQDGKALLDQFSQNRISDSKLLEIASKVEIFVDEELDNQYPDNWGSRLEIETESETYVVDIKNAKGDPTKPLSQTELEDKFIYLTKDRIGKNQALELIEIINDLENYNDLQGIFALCKPNYKETKEEKYV